MKDYCTGCPVLKKSFFAALKPSNQKLAVCIMVYGNYKKRQILFQQGNPATRVFAVKSGLMKAYKTNQNGKDQLIALYGPGDVFALEGLSLGTYDVTVEVVADAELCFFEAAQFMALLKENRALSLEVIKILSKALTDSHLNLLDAGTKTAAERLASFLLRLLPPDGSRELVLPLSRGEVGNIIGTSIETISRQLRHLQDRRIIRLKGKRLHILDRRQLESLAA